MPFFDIGPDFIKEMKMGQFLTPPENARSKTTKGNDEPTVSWREKFVIQQIVVTEDGKNQDGTEIVQLTLLVPSDVTSANQGRRADEWLRFPWGRSKNGDKGAKVGCSISYRALCDFAKAAGYTGDITNLGQFAEQVAPGLAGMRVEATVAIGPDNDGATRQHIQYFRAPK